MTELIVACNNFDRIFMKPLLNGENFIFVYKFLFKELNVLFPLMPFECRILMAINIVPNQLHPNS